MADASLPSVVPSVSTRIRGFRIGSLPSSIAESTSSARVTPAETDEADEVIEKGERDTDDWIKEVFPTPALEQDHR